MEGKNAKNILLVAENFSFIMTSLIQHLEDASYHVFKTVSTVSDVNKITEQMQVLLLYSDENSVMDMQMLVYMKDKAIEEELPIFLIGDREQMNFAKTIIPEYLIKQEFLRPINVKEVVTELDNYLRHEGTTQKKKILVVDDSGAMLRNVKGWLEGKYQVILANSGAMAIKYLAMDKPDLVLLDYEMPIIDGKQVLEMIRSEMDFSNIPVIFLTSKSDKESVKNVMALKPDGYLLKTLNPVQIVQAVEDFFERRKARE